jgi:hypothetical protein
MKTYNIYKVSRQRMSATLIATAWMALVTISCEEFIEIEPPRTDLVKSTVFASDETANAAVLDLYYQMRSFGFASSNINSISYYTSLSSDEMLNNYAPTEQFRDELNQFNNNTILPNNGNIAALWTQMYKCIYKTNAILEGISGSTSLSEKARTQLAGEAKFIRAFCHIYLVNLFGDIPLIVTTDYTSNTSAPRSQVDEVYAQIVKDLAEAKQLLPATYSDYSNLRIRPNATAATALLARAYLYHQDWAAAETEASLVIGNSALYSLTPQADIFRANSTEPIFQLWSDYYPTDLLTYGDPGKCELTPGFIASFEPGDSRRTNWVFEFPSGGRTVYLAYKYHILATPTTEYSTLLRLGEQYLIRAEARAHLGNHDGGLADLNAIRVRAGLGASTASDQSSLLAAIEQERRVELFTEWGHRWFDLKRTGKADAVLTPLKPQWKPTAVLYPLPESELTINAALKGHQNPGY